VPGGTEEGLTISSVEKPFELHGWLLSMLSDHVARLGFYARPPATQQSREYSATRIRLVRTTYSLFAAIGKLEPHKTRCASNPGCFCGVRPHTRRVWGVWGQTSTAADKVATL
jgi:hypothetical protein